MSKTAKDGVTTHYGSDMPPGQWGPVIYLGRMAFGPNTSALSGTFRRIDDWSKGPKFDAKTWSGNPDDKAETLVLPPFDAVKHRAMIEMLEEHGKVQPKDRTVKRLQSSTATESIADTKRAHFPYIPEQSETRVVDADEVPDFSPGSADDDGYWEAQQ